MTTANRRGCALNVGWKTLVVLHFVEIVDLVSTHPKIMSDTAPDISDIDKTDAEELTDYHRQKLRQEEAEASEPKPVYLRGSPVTRGGAVVGLWIVGFIFGIIMQAPPPTAALLGIITASIGFISITQRGVIMKRMMSDLDLDTQQQSQTSSSPDSKRICPSCGWRNPDENNYCHDCGEELGGNNEKQV